MAPQVGPKISPLRAPLGHRPLPVDQKDRLRQAARPPPPQPEQNSTTVRASTGRCVSQSKTARRGALPRSARLVSPMAQQHGGVRFYMAPRQQPEHSNTGAPPQSAMTARTQQHGGVRFCFCRAAMAARDQKHGAVGFYQALRQPEQNSTAGCASTECAPRQPEGATARQRALLHGATSAARAQQRGGVRFHRAPWQSDRSRTAACASTERRDSQGTAGAPFLPLHFFY